MPESSTLINILTAKLPGTITRPLFTEYNNRRREIADILAWKDSTYQVLREYESVVDSLLAMSLFYRYVLGHIQGATSFYRTVNQRSQANNECGISFGNNVLNREQQGHMMAAVISFNKIQEKFQLYPAFYEFSETAQFLKNCKDLLYIRDYEEDDTI